MQDRLDKLEHDYENLMEQIRPANQERFGRHTEKLTEIAGQLSFFNEAEACYDENANEPAMEEAVNEPLQKPRKPKKKGQREEDLKEFPQEIIPKADLLFFLCHRYGTLITFVFQLLFQNGQILFHKIIGRIVSHIKICFDIPMLHFH